MLYKQRFFMITKIHLFTNFKILNFLFNILYLFKQNQMLYLIFLFFYSIENYNLTSIQSINERINSINNNISIINSYFESIFQTNSNGGAIILESTKYFFVLIKKSIFNSCSVSDGYNGGAIYINLPNSPTIIDYCCAYKCHTGLNQVSYTGFGQFLFLSPSIFFQNIFFSTISSCSSQHSHPIVNNGDEQNILYSNFSYNYVYHSSTVWLHNGKIGKINFCTFFNNIASKFIFLYIDILSIIFENCNMIKNNQYSIEWGGYFQGFYQSNTQSIIQKCIFLENNLQLNTKLFTIVAGTLLLNNCYIDNFSYNSKPVSISNSLSITNSFKLYHMNTKDCIAINPFISNTEDIKKKNLKFILLNFFIIY